jgi:hypothetical protein
MALSFSILQDAPDDIQDEPLFKLLQWIRNSVSDFGMHYTMIDGPCIMDFGLLKQEITDAIEMDDFDGPDIRDWLTKQIEEGRCLVWVSW